MTEKKLTISHGLHGATQRLESVDELSNTAYYAFVGKPQEYDDDDTIIETPEDSESYIRSVYREMVFGKRITSSDVNLLIPRHDWTSNTSYVQFDDTDGDIHTKEFYATVNAGALYHTYKCIYNAEGIASTIEPNFDSVSESDPYYETSDGYKWKYMFTVNNSIVAKFATSSWFPAIANTSVETYVRVGSIDNIVVESGGTGYSNYLSGNNMFAGGSLRLDGNNLIYDISGNTSASSANDFYNGCYIYIKGGNNNETGQYNKITDYYVNSTNKAIVVENAFANSLGVAAVYDIYPGVIIVGDGSQTSNAVARATVNTSTNTVNSIEMLNNGLGYKTAVANAYSAPEISVSNATLRVINSPYNGHGANTELELGATALGMSISFSNTESNAVLVENDFRTVGIIKDPKFSNVIISTSNASGTFIENETVYEIAPVRVGLDANILSTSTTVTAATADLDNQFTAGDKVFFSYNVSEAAGNNSFIGVVNAVTNSSHMVLDSNAAFSQDGVSFYIPNVSTVSNVVTSNTTTITLTNVEGVLETNDILIGNSSGAVATVNSISRSGVTKGFSTFINTHKYIGSIISGTFVEDEFLTQGSSNVVLHSVVDDTDFYVIKPTGIFELGEAVTGANSAAVASFSTHYNPELIFMSGEIIYLENIEAVERSLSQTETIKFIFEF